MTKDETAYVKKCEWEYLDSDSAGEFIACGLFSDNPPCFHGIRCYPVRKICEEFSEVLNDKTK